MSTTTVAYPVVKQTYTKTVACADCGRQLRRRRTFTQTLHPDRPDGATTVEQVRDAIDRSDVVAAWRVAPSVCAANCPGSAVIGRRIG